MQMYVVLSAHNYVPLDEYLINLSTYDLNEIINSDSLLVSFGYTTFKKKAILDEILEVRINKRIKKLNKI